jgi:2-keto-4-pentenoate hydratase/2-oxohepta-3-ene-1,7-dioic acid hydratase in catechol pathway
MKLLSFVRPNDHAPSWGFVDDKGGVIDAGAGKSTLRQALAEGRHKSGPGRSGADYRIDDIVFLPVIPDPDKIFGIGVNYKTHLAESGREQPKHPMIFLRFANSQVGHRQPIIRPNVSDQLDYEGELAVIIGERCRHVSAAESKRVVAGFSCYNDGSVRDWQRHTGQFTPGKNFPKTGGFGPWMVTPDEMGDPGRATLVTRLNGQEVQRATLDDLVFDVPALVAYCSTFTELEPGDVIITGTTGGVGLYRTPQLWMKPGDKVEVEISGIGLLENTVQQES